MHLRTVSTQFITSAPMCPTSLLLFCITLSQIAAVEPVDQGAKCSPKTCGNLTISDPFGFVPEQETDMKCGQLGFEVHCNNNIPYLGYYRHKYRFRILNIFYDNSSLLVADIHKLGDFSASDSKGCHVLTANTSSKVGLPFSVSPVNLNLIFYNCTKTPEASRGLAETKCSSGLFVRVGIGGHYNDSSNYTQYSVEGCSTTLVPVLRTFGKVNASNYEKLISDGFLLTWQLTFGWPGCATPSAPLTTGSKSAGKDPDLSFLDDSRVYASW